MFTIYIKETNYGYASFDTKEQAEEWMEEPDYSCVKWIDTLDSEFDIVQEES